MAKNKSEPKEAVEPKVEAVEEIEAPEKVEEAPVEVKPQFKNNSEKGIKIKLVNGKKFEWITVKPGDIVTIPKKIAKANGLVKVN